MYYKAYLQNGQEESDHEDFRDKRDAVKTLNAYKDAQLDPDLVKNIYYWDDEGNTIVLIDKGKRVRGKITLKQLGESNEI